MCDTFVVPASKTVDKSVLFGKNSDREPNEAQEIAIYPARDYASGETLRCTYREIPQAAHTYGVLLSRPFWMWGAEMGVNERGVVIGNEAVFTRFPQEKQPALTGMDLLRLGLERAASAREALEVITTMLDAYGQGGNCGMDHALYYHNSFLIVDFHEAWVLETAGREWAAEKVVGVRSISNAITIQKEWDLASPKLVHTAVERGWVREPRDFNFARAYSDLIYTRFSAAAYRQACSTRLLEAKQGEANLETVMETLRSHGGDEKSPRLDRAVTGAEICMHAGFGPIRASQTAGSLVVDLREDRQTIWVTGSAAPCTAIFKPVWLDTGLPWKEPSPDGHYSSETLWWRHERLHRAVLEDYSTRLGLYQAERSALEARFRGLVQEAGPDPDRRAQVSLLCFHKAEAAEAAWLERVKLSPIRNKKTVYYESAWRGFNRKACI